MKRCFAILMCALLSGCTGADYSPLQRDLAQLAELPKRLDDFVKGTATSKPETGAQPEPQPVAVAEPEQAVQPPAQRPRPKLADLFARREPGQTTSAYDKIEEPVAIANPLVRPPWEAFEAAGPGANDDLDLETLYGAGNIPAELQQPDIERQVAATGEAGAPDLPATDAQSPPAPDQPQLAKSADVVIKAVAVLPVKGARGEGNSELTTAMRTALRQAGWPVLTASRKDALTVQGRVAIGKPHGPNQSVKIVWDVLTPDGKSLGDLKQDNSVPAGSLDQTWGENAQFAADAAAEGIFKLIQKYR
jgi:hypothetical protein